MASLLAETGQDMASPSGFQLRSLLDEFSCVHALRARADLLGHKAHIATPSSYSGDACAAARPYPDYQAMVVMPVAFACHLLSSHGSASSCLA